MTPSPRGPGSIWAVVTVFRPSGVPPLLAQLRTQVDGVIVVDDGSGPGFDAVLDSIESSGVVVLRLERNSGIGSALNRGMRHARQAGASWIVTFDQDSSIAHDFVDALLSASDAAAAEDVSAGPVVPEYFASVRQAGRREGASTVLAAHAIQSGMLIPVSVLDRVGDMDEGLFIDLVDTDFELRCADAGLPCIVAQGLALEHHLGARYRVRGPLGRVLPVLTLSTPFRYYYRARNRIIIERRHRGHGPRLRGEGIADRIYFVIAIALASPRSTMRRLIRDGRRDGRGEMTGPMSPELAAAAASVRWRAERLPD
ncbi:glycosyltransferase [Microbacterium phyllosphaerae]|uniref:glycosyltransferase n=1 Tax=Microbacterium phyllosphaerae TaxID=124798 RepID=UPI000EA28902|nr:glycosyltransferase [Microbacterium phyllosphaerae]